MYWNDSNRIRDEGSIKFFIIFIPINSFVIFIYGVLLNFVINNFSFKIFKGDGLFLPLFFAVIIGIITTIFMWFKLILRAKKLKIKSEQDHK